MPDDSRGKRLPDPAAAVTFDFEGRSVEARAGDSVAAALIASGVLVTRNTPVSGAPRGPFCLMGACFECLMEIDGQANRQACMTEVRDGMAVRPMQGARGLEPGTGDD